MRRYLASVAIKEIEIKARPCLHVRLTKHKNKWKGEGKGRGRRRRGR